jgi:DNA invertase Pin-like site-specific DNA recombinase
MPTAVIYTRVATEDQVGGTSLDTQERACREWCERNGAEVLNVYVDAGESAKTAARPAFLRLVEAFGILELARTGQLAMRR